MDPINKNETATQLEKIVCAAVESLAIDSIKEAANRCFRPESNSYWYRLKDHLLGPITVGAVVLAIASWLAQHTIEAIRNDATERANEISNYVEIYQKYKDSHRLRWLHGGQLRASLTWGFPYEVVLKRKHEYDNAYVTTNRLFPAARDYLDKALFRNTADFYTEKSPAVFRNFFDKNLRDVSTIHDFCLTSAFAARNNWEEALWHDAITAEGSRPHTVLKKERDAEVYAKLESCEYRGKFYRYGAIAQVYSICTDAIFQSFEFAYQTKLYNDSSNFSEWHQLTILKIEEACRLKEIQHT